MKASTAQELFVHQIKDIYDAEKQSTRIIPKIAKACSDPELRSSIEQHLEQTQGQVGRLERVFQTLGVAVRGVPCLGMKGLVEETSEVMAGGIDELIIDSAILGAARKQEHYEIAAYDAARALAQVLGMKEAADLGDIGMIRLDFPGYSGEQSLKPIEWDQWFEKFDSSGSALVYEGTTAKGQESNFNKLVRRKAAEGRRTRAAGQPQGCGVQPGPGEFCLTACMHPRPAESAAGGNGTDLSCTGSKVPGGCIADRETAQERPPLLTPAFAECTEQLPGTGVSVLFLPGSRVDIRTANQARQWFGLSPKSLEVLRSAPIEVEQAFWFLFVPSTSEAKNVLPSVLIQAGSPNSLLGFLPIVLIFAIFYFLLFLPMQRQKKQQQKMLRELQNGQSVLTNGGIIGTIISIGEDETLVLRVKPDNIKIQVARSAVSSLVVAGEIKK